MSLFVLPVTSSDLTQLQSGIQFFTTDAQAQAQTALINNNQGTVFSYAQTLLANNVSTSQVAMADFAFALNKTDTVAHLTGISTQFLPPQINFAVAKNLEGGPTVYAAQVYALALAQGFKEFATSLDSQVKAGTFVTTTANLTGTNASAISNFFNVWFNFYNNPANSAALLGVTASVAAAASAWGDAMGAALVRTPDDTGPGADTAHAIQALVANALFDIVQGIYKEGVPIQTLPQHAPFQGEGGGGFNTFTLTPGIDGPTGFISTVKGAIFNALPASQGPAGGVTNTLNAQDNFGTTGLTDAKDQGTLNFTAVANTLGGNPPLATNITMSGVRTANIINNAGETAGFSGTITGLTDVTASGNGGILLGTAGAGLNTALQNIAINSNLPGIGFVGWMTADALKGTADTVAIKLSGPTGAFPTAGTPLGTLMPVTLNVTSGTNGYETMTIDSGGGAGGNFIQLNTNATSTSKVDVTGSQRIHLEGSAMNIANLHTLNGSATSGGLEAVFNGTGNVAATGGTGNDVFTFLTGFTKDSSVNGGGGNDRVITVIDSGAILGVGVGPNLVSVEVIEHRTSANAAGNSNPATGAFTADMSRMGSATELDLQGHYNNNDVNVSNLTDAQTVVYSGPPLGLVGGINRIDDLFLTHTNPAGGNVNFTMAQTLTSAVAGDMIVQNLHVAGINLNLVTAGKATNNFILNVSDVKANVNIEGGTHLDFGTTAAGAYGFKTGVIDASKTTGGVNTWLAGDSTNVTPGTETFIGGSGNDRVHFLDFRSDVANFTQGGSDVAEYHTFQALNTFAVNSTGYLKVIGFTLDDALEFHASTVAPGAGGLFSTLPTAAPNAVAAGDPLVTLNEAQNVALNPANAQDFNYIHLDTPVSVGALTPIAAFAAAIGTGSVINFSAVSHQYLASLYDTVTSQAMFFSVNPTVAGVATTLTAADAGSVNVIGMVGMSQADYAALGNAQIHFLA